jgi:cysteinyl-tRNA synthetase
VQDFALWKSVEPNEFGYDSPWGKGRPGWHIECSVMSEAFLGETFDIHAGGIDLMFPHHENEIAQSEAKNEKEFVRYFVHGEHILVDNQKMSKSKGNFYVLNELIEKGFDPMAYRYLVLTAHYRDKLNFTFESLQAAQNALNNLREQVRDWPAVILNDSEEYILRYTQDDNTYYSQFLEALNNDLNTSQALAVIWNMVRSDLPMEQKGEQLLLMDKILGLKLDEYIGKKLEIPDDVQKLVEQREKVRADKDFAKSDELRNEIKKLGFDVLDTPTGQKLKAND